MQYLKIRIYYDNTFIIKDSSVICSLCSECNVLFIKRVCGITFNVIISKGFFLDQMSTSIKPVMKIRFIKNFFN